MAALELFNTLTLKLERLEPVGAPALRMYACGPTVYDYGHIGNFRTFLHVDVLRRFLRQQGMAVEHVMNITDVDDKIIRNALAAGKSIAEYTARFEKAFFEDMDALGIERPEHVPRATEHIPEMVSLIEKLAAKDIAYQTEDGSWYFRIAQLRGLRQALEEGLRGDRRRRTRGCGRVREGCCARLRLWKAVKAATSRAGRRALGAGRPGWHIECSAMAKSLLGESFDLHAGGEDLMFPHHENEIAQSRVRPPATPSRGTGCMCASCWSKARRCRSREGNFYTLRDLLLKGHRASAIRYLLLSRALSPPDELHL